ncbi:MAG: hypothetical protein H7Z19_03095 [Chitinophagaceae bacterium]|nr:hypothetical protein [Rubrivivax sp.]
MPRRPLFAAALFVALLPGLTPAHAACLTDAEVAALFAAYQARTPATNPEGLNAADGECSRAKLQ